MYTSIASWNLSINALQLQPNHYAYHRLEKSVRHTIAPILLRSWVHQNHLKPKFVPFNPPGIRSLFSIAAEGAMDLSVSVTLISISCTGLSRGLLTL